MKLDLQVDLVQDNHSKDNFDRIQQKIEDNSLLKFDCKFVKFSFEDAGTYQVGHGLNRVPLDLIPTRIVGDVTFNYEDFTDEFIDVTTTGPADVRCFVGTFAEDRYEDLDIR